MDPLFEFKRYANIFFLPSNLSHSLSMSTAIISPANRTEYTNEAMGKQYVCVPGGIWREVVPPAFASVRC